MCRWEWEDATTEKGRDKTFVQRRPDPSKKDGWTFSTKGVEQLPYRLPELLEAINSEEEVFIVEGEKKADMLWALGVPATCNTGGAGKFPETLIQWFRGARVTILPDNDPQSHKPDGSPMFHSDGRPVRPGQDHAEKVGSKLINTAARVRILEIPGLPSKGGVDDWLPDGGSADELYRLAKATPGINENDSADIGKVLERCDRIRRATGAHVMLVHHMNAEGARPRGHTSLLANVETVIVTRKLEDRHDRDGRLLREFELRKQKEGEAGTKTRFVLPVIDIGTDEDGEPVTSCVVATPSGAESGSSTGKPSGIQLGGANQVGLRVLYDLLAGEGTGFFAPPELGLPYGARVADRKAWSARFYEISRPEGFDDLDDDEKEKSRANLRKQFERVRDLLVSKGIIGLDSTNAWAMGRPVMGFGPPPGFSTRKPATGPAYAPPDDVPFAE